MALTFGQQRGSAIKNTITSYKFVEGENRLRIVGDILPRYVYWIKGENNKDLPIECLAFDREAEAFLNKEKDWVRHYYPDLKCSWSYLTQAIVDGKVIVVNLKKKLWEEVVEAAETLGDPTDIETGWDLVISRKKTGALAFNVAYSLSSLKCKSRPLTAEEREAIKDLKSMDEVMPRPTPDAQKELLERLNAGTTAAANTDDEVLDDHFKVD